VYGLPVPENLQAVIEQKVDMFLHGAPAAMRKLRQTRTTAKPLAAKRTGYRKAGHAR
jgi:hypothetical protein